MSYSHGKLATWRDTHVLDALDEKGPAERFSVGAAIISPTYLPGGVIGAVVWATADADFTIEPVFRDRASALQALALQFNGADHEPSVRGAAVWPPQLTRRQIQCLQWGAAGKTDSKISVIMSISGADRALSHDQRRTQARTSSAAHKRSIAPRRLDMSAWARRTLNAAWRVSA